VAASAYAFASRVVGAQALTSRGRTWRAVQKLLDGWSNGRQMAGCAAALSIAGGPFTCLTAGTIALESHTPFDETSLCRIYSMTKSVTGIAVMQLVERGKLSLDLPVGSYEVVGPLGAGGMAKGREYTSAPSSTASLESRDMGLRPDPLRALG
jgi:CubicO group peptidase (beta-lactamase class C family)